MSFTSSSWYRTLRVSLLLQLLLMPPCLLHPQPCHLLAQIGHTVRVGALLPTQRAARIQVQAALSRAAAAMSRDRDRDRDLDWDPDPDRESYNFLPYNLSLELVSRQPAAADPESLFRCVCQGVVVQGVSAVLAFPQTREELLQVDFMASFLEIPFLSVFEHGEPLRTQVRYSPLCKLHLDPERQVRSGSAGLTWSLSWGLWVSVIRFDLDLLNVWGLWCLGKHTERVLGHRPDPEPP